MKLYATVEAVLKNEPNYVTDDGDLKKWVIISKAQNCDAELISILLENPEVKTHFFIPIKDVLVFNQALFIEFMEQKNYLNDSFTAYKNKIGLTTDGKFLNQRNEVALVWPYKDCVLEGGQSREEDKREEIFFNEVLAQDEINQLLDPKVVTNVKTFTAEGEKAFEGFTRNEQGTITDNLVIKGNNLLDLHSLKEEFAGKVKLIYIDPPYNTGSDGFKYNDNFNHSTWLTFMRNRLVVARDLLKNEGVIFVQCDDNEQGYLKVLMDDIFTSSNFIETFIWKNTDNAPTLSKKSRKNIEFIHCYEKSINTSKGYKGRNSDNDDAPLLNSGNPITTLEFQNGLIQFKIADGIYKKGNYDKIEIIDDLVVENGLNKNTIRLQGQFKWQQSFLDDEITKGTYFLIKSNLFSIRYQRKTASNIAPDKFLDENYLSKAIGVETNEDSKKHIDSLKLNFDSYPKPETLIAFLIKAVTEENDIVLDYHLGSGTTCATAHKIKRQYIGIEQLDYIETVAVERLKKVIAGEQGGISKSVNWQGGGSFTYLELKKYNQTFVDKILEAKDSETLFGIWEEMKNKSFLNYNIAIQKQSAHIEDFKKLEFSVQQELLIALLDKNQLYVNLSSLKDVDFECTAEELKVTQDFYQLKK
ncbi:DNA methyltransferase [Flavobacterium restrictum]|uniref:site-specific DNA-methyltransferase (adenine-specific) n=1 Tax=Flavobacterium restrictum TaxID=2594428 RepID=A0A553EB04_9FLAO|nr:site-specific DNA-methyltransferase [Flavobacterium restrictum]TRX42228.1 site-specific DNA-methyltransferase [Flavobacterium restrictum]